MLILGGVGRLYGAFIGVPLYMIVQDRSPRSIRSIGISGSACSWCWSWCSRAAARSGSASAAAPAARAQECGVSEAALETRALSMSFGALARRQRDRFPPRGRRAPRAHRPQRRRQDHLRQSRHRRARARAPGASCWAAPTSRASRRRSASSAASRARSRSTRSSAASPCSRTSRSRWASGSASRGDHAAAGRIAPRT